MSFPRQYFTILNMLTRPDPVVSYELATTVADKNELPFYPNAPRFSKFFEILKKRRQKATSSAQQ
ncbi:MAG: hypothetical protein FJW36_26310 [Acidobacteria bacterium]|nr:hypothetical protein [Acidobacteriota bacterium]